jgi:hypothetical protein
MQSETRGANFVVVANAETNFGPFGLDFSVAGTPVPSVHRNRKKVQQNQR